MADEAFKRTREYHAVEINHSFWGEDTFDLVVFDEDGSAFALLSRQELKALRERIKELLTTQPDARETIDF